MKAENESGKTSRNILVTFSALFLLVFATESPAACLQKATTSNKGALQQVTMLAPASEVAQYTALGFSPVQCPSDMSVMKRYVARICAASGTSVRPLLNTAKMFGKTREQACASATAGLRESGG